MHHLLGVDSSELHVVTTIGRLRVVASGLPPFTIVAVIRLICNARCTTRRFGKPVAPCSLCGCAEGDDIRHYVACPAFSYFSLSSAPRLGFPWDGASPPLLVALLLSPALSARDAKVACILIEALLAGVYARRSVVCADVVSAFGALAAKLRSTAAKDQRVAAALRRAR